MNSLDREVAEAFGWKFNTLPITDTGKYLTIPRKHWRTPQVFEPSTNWQQAGELLEKYCLSLWMGSDCVWYAAYKDHDAQAVAQTPQEAICKALIALCKEKGK